MITCPAVPRSGLCSLLPLYLSLPLSFAQCVCVCVCLCAANMKFIVLWWLLSVPLPTPFTAGPTKLYEPPTRLESAPVSGCSWLPSGINKIIQRQRHRSQLLFPPTWALHCRLLLQFFPPGGCIKNLRQALTRIHSQNTKYDSIYTWKNTSNWKGSLFKFN